MSFQSVQKKIAGKEHIPMKNAGAILANASRNASPEAKEKNPKLSRVKGAPNMAKGRAPKMPPMAMPPQAGAPPMPPPNMAKGGKVKSYASGKWAARKGQEEA